MYEQADRKSTPSKPQLLWLWTPSPSTPTVLWLWTPSPSTPTLLWLWTPSPSQPGLVWLWTPSPSQPGLLWLWTPSTAAPADWACVTPRAEKHQLVSRQSHKYRKVIFWTVTKLNNTNIDGQIRRRCYTAQGERKVQSRARGLLF